MSTNSLVKTSCISVVLALMSLLAKAQLTADFSANPLSGCAPLVVNFTDHSAGAPTQWKWDLGNGTISFLQNPSVTYFNPGQYTVKLIVQNASGIDSVTRIQYITIYAQPVVNFSATPLSGCFPLPVQFTDLSAPGSGTITQWEWDFGDGNTSSLPNPSHTYTAAGNYNVSLRITNSNGCIRNVTRLQYVQISNGVHAGFSNSVPNSCTPPVNIAFQNLSTGTGALTYQWNFGDGNTSAQANPSHNYNSAGNYTVQLIVTNSTGCRDTLIRTNAINIGTVNAAFSAPDSVCANNPFTLNNTSVPAPVSVVWHFGDGTTSTAFNPVKTFALPGTYQVKLVSNFGACTDSVVKPIVVLAQPVSAFTGNPVMACQAPLTVNFSNTSANAVSYQWDFGDGNTSGQFNPTHTYNTPGHYSVTLITTNAYGCTDTLTRSEYIKIELPTVSINNLPAEGCAPLALNFSSAVISNDAVTGYLWDFGDGNTSVAAAPAHVFAAGSYDIKLTITTASGCTATITVPAGVRAGIKPVANFNADPTNVCAMTPVNFFDLSTGTIDTWLWDFGDGGTSSLQNPTHVYEDTGYFNIRLIVSNNGCSDTLQIPDYIHVDPPIALFRIDLDCGAAGKRIFTDQSIGADTWSWDFGDGNTSSLQNPVHTYAAPGTYTISLTVTNNLTGCSYVKSQATQVVIEPVDFTADDMAICRNSLVAFTASAASANITAHEWLFGDGAGAAGTPVTHVYTNAGAYDVSLIVTDINGCRDTIIKPGYILVNGPTANFGVLVAGTCSMNVVPLSDSSLTDGTHPISSWTWYYGDGITETLASGPFQHLYSAPGIYTLSLTVTDTEGCADSIARSSLLTISQPVADFMSPDTVTCPSQLITFVNASTGPGLQYAWNFGDGATSTLASPTHTYAADDFYTIKLVIIDQYGCSDTLIRDNYIRLSTPHADFAVSDTLGTCPPLVVNFTNNSSNFTAINWDFGDGTSAQTANPSHFYSTPGTYIATLTVSSPGNCTSSKQQVITVRGPQGTFTYGGLTGCDPMTVNFVASTRDRISFIWDFNDGTTVSGIDSVISHTYTIPGVYVPKMILVDAGGCVVPITGPDTIKVNGVTAAFDFLTQALCNAGSVQFNNNTVSNDGIQSYHWDFGDGNISTAASPLHFYTTTGIYQPQLIVTTLSGCVDSLNSIAPVKIVAVPQALMNQSANGCTPLSVSFSGSLAVADTSAVTWSWTFGNGNVSALQNPPAQPYTTAGNYGIRLLVRNSSGCVDTVLSAVDAFLVPTIFAGLDTMICQGTGTTLNATGAAGYTWTPSAGLSCTGCASPVATPDSITNYKVKGTTAQGCSNTDSVWVAVKYPFKMTSSIADTLCIGSSVRLQATGGYSYSWSPSAGLSSTTIANPVAAPGSTTTYQVIGTDNKRCFSDTAYIPITVYPIPVVEAGPDVTINVGQMTDLVPTVSPDVTNVIWAPTGSIFRNNYPAITVKPRETTTYTVEVTNDGGCRATDNLTVFVICNGSNVFIPNTFSPNGDGSNDIFYPRGTGLFSIKKARIFNRWGEIVYERNDFMANDASAGWDGTFKGAKLNPDVYVYIIDILCDNNTTLPLKGNVALIR
jgi:gliding motility-associated-like protein